jgi:hypothetical protein
MPHGTGQPASQPTSADKKKTGVMCCAQGQGNYQLSKNIKSTYVPTI